MAAEITKAKLPETYVAQEEPFFNRKSRPRIERKGGKRPPRLNQRLVTRPTCLTVQSQAKKVMVTDAKPSRRR